MRPPFMIDVFGAFLILVFVVTQIVIPIWTGRKLFPMFNRRRWTLSAMAVDAHEEADVISLKREIKEIKGKTKGPPISERPLRRSSGRLWRTPSLGRSTRADRRSSAARLPQYSSGSLAEPRSRSPRDAQADRGSPPRKF